jgi:secretory carrier-associated membrane protein
MRLYNAAIKDRAFTYAWFFLMYAAHLIFCVWSAVSPPLPMTNDWSHTGFLTGIKAFGENTFVAIVYIIGGCLWTLESLWSLWVIKMVGSHNSSGGKYHELIKHKIISPACNHL